MLDKAKSLALRLFASIQSHGDEQNGSIYWVRTLGYGCFAFGRRTAR